jgi:AcrR family transcriptional regulator
MLSEKQKAVYTVALRVFARHGLKKTTVEDIATELGMSKGNIYLYARNKKDLYHNTVVFALKRWQKQVRKAVEAQTDAKSMFVTMCRKAVDYLSKDDDFRNVLIHDPDIFPMFPQNDPYKLINNESLAMIRRILKKGMADGVFKTINPETSAQAIFSIYKMFIIRIYIKPEGKAMQKVFTETLNLITQGLYLDT